MGRRKKVTTFQFTSSQSKWLKQFVTQYIALEDADPEDESGNLAKFIESTYTKLTEKYNLEDPSKKDTILPVCAPFQVLFDSPYSRRARFYASG